MNILSPSILSADFANLEREIKQVEEGGATYLHIDVMDGLFVPDISFGTPIIKCIRSFSQLFLDVHLMVREPHKHIEQFANSGADGITIHVESTQFVRETLERIRARGLKAGLSLKLNTPIEAVEPYLECVDTVLVMSVEPGKGGQSYEEVATERIIKMKELIKCKNPIAKLEVDGGIKKDNVAKILEAGADIIVIGSDIFSGSIMDNTKYFLKVMNE